MNFGREYFVKSMELFLLMKKKKLKDILITSSWKLEFAQKTRYEKPYKPTGIKQSESGGFWSWLKPKFGFLNIGGNNIGILMIGLDAAGKTTILYKLKHGEVVTSIPTIGFNVESVKYKNITLFTWDVGGPDKIRPLWRHYYQLCNCLIFVVDSNDRERSHEAAEELRKTLEEPELALCPVLIFLNKQDLPNALTVEELTYKLGLNSMKSLLSRPWFVQASCATSGDGLYEGLDWLSNTIEDIKNSRI